MPGSFKMVMESIFFSPVFFLLLMLVSWFFSLRMGKEKHQKDHRSIFLLKAFAWLWVFLLFTTNVLFYHALAYPLRLITPESRKHQADAIVVASAGVEASGAPSVASTQRAHAAAELYLDQLAPVVIVTGGVTAPYRPPATIKGIPIILQGMGVPPGKIIIENRSADTYSNGIETVKILNEYGMKSILLVSHDYHLFRVAKVFEKLGVTVYPLSANQMEIQASTPWWNYFDWENYNRIKTVVHEYIGLIHYKLTGRI